MAKYLQFEEETQDEGLQEEDSLIERPKDEAGCSSSSSSDRYSYKGKQSNQDEEEDQWHPPTFSLFIFWILDQSQMFFVSMCRNYSFEIRFATVASFAKCSNWQWIFAIDYNVYKALVDVVLIRLYVLAKFLSQPTQSHWVLFLLAIDLATTVCQLPSLRFTLHHQFFKTLHSLGTAWLLLFGKWRTN